jgi:hypothetical protein
MNYGLGSRDDRFAARWVFEVPGSNIRSLLYLAHHGVYSKPQTQTSK